MFAELPPLSRWTVAPDKETALFVDKVYGVRVISALRFEIACSTLVHAVDCVRIAPTITSKGSSAGHQF